LRDSTRGDLIDIVVAVEPYMVSYRSSVMAAKLLSERAGISLRIVGSKWLADRAFDSYMPCFFAEFKDGKLITMRAEENLNHRQLARLLEDDLMSVVNQRSRTTAATAAP